MATDGLARWFLRVPETGMKKAAALEQAAACQDVWSALSGWGLVPKRCDRWPR
jgi:hypothetical protein